MEAASGGSGSFCRGSVQIGGVCSRCMHHAHCHHQQTLLAGLQGLCFYVQTRSTVFWHLYPWQVCRLHAAPCPECIHLSAHCRHACSRCGLFSTADRPNRVWASCSCTLLIMFSLVITSFYSNGSCTRSLLQRNASASLFPTYMQCLSMAIAAHLTSTMSEFALLSVSDRATLRAQVCLNIASGLALTVPCVINLLCRMTAMCKSRAVAAACKSQCAHIFDTMDSVTWAL